MPIIKISTSRRSQLNELTSLIEQSCKKLSAFCAEKMKEAGLITDKFTFEFDFNRSKRGFQKSANRFVSVIKRKLISENPYLDKCAGGTPYIQVAESNQGVFMRVLLEKPPVYDAALLSMEEQTRLFTGMYKKIERYIDYIENLCIKNGVPILISGEVIPTGHTVVEAGYSYTHRLALSVHMGVPISGGGYTYYPASGETRQNLVGDPALGTSEYIPPEVIFTKLPEILKVLKTLTRETDYDYTAFGVERTEIDGHQV